MKVIKREQVTVVGPAPVRGGGFQRTSFDGGEKPSSTTTPKNDELLALKETLLKEAQAREAAAFARGKEEGLREAREGYRRELQRQVEALGEIVAALAACRRDLVAGAERDILELCLAMARKIIHHEVTTNPEVIRHVLHGAIEQLLDREDMVIRLHPEDHRYLMEIKEDFLRGIDGMKNVILQSDPAVGRGGAVVETRFGEVDARVEEQFEVMRDALRS
ncbi:MAG TPA: FliH/SctL family protein [Syntrophales bacterium]|nr:FliH/SctL family protein [Syntrophales bacterium]HOM07612.1 FliH/SctL family protein [Syntrophales bacterium]HON99432.1 FliH/SctL family protein [Syntrophales bacterium]HPC00532.1 FliH/SctL family protein [Syntrophales bacterium]HPQ06703.1 FliH/SctL family protein [Syntrophales bacterium]